MTKIQAQLRRPGAGAIKYDILTAINCAAYAGLGITKDLAQRLTGLITARYNWATNEISAAQTQMAEMWSVDVRRVKRILKSLRDSGILYVKKAGVRGRATVYGLRIETIIQITRPVWARVGKDLFDRLSALFPEPQDSGPRDPSGDRREVKRGDGDREEERSEPMAGSESTPEREQRTASGSGSELKTALAQQLPPAVFERWISPLTINVSTGAVTVLASSAFVADYVERVYRDIFDKALWSLFAEKHSIEFAVLQSVQRY